MSEETLIRDANVKREKVASASGDVLEAQVAKLRSLFPEVFADGKIDFDKLKTTLGAAAESGPGRFHFSWAGKDDAIALLQTPSRGTLVPLPTESTDFDSTANAFIEGDNLEVLKLLFKPYFGRVKMIYIDPPYNTGQDFIYPDNYADPLTRYLQITGQADAEGNLLTSNPETSGRYHSSWLSMMYPRLFVARQLLRDDGVVFVSIDDREAHHLRLLMNEVFGEENFICQFVWHSKKGGGGDVATVTIEHQYVIAYAKDSDSAMLGKIKLDGAELTLEDDKGAYRKGRELNKWGAGSSRQDRPTMFFPIPGPNGEDVFPIRNDGSEGRWRLGKTEMLRLAGNKNILFERRPDNTYIAYEKIRSNDQRYKAYRSLLLDVGTVADGTADLKKLFDGKSPFDFPKPVSLIRQLLQIGAASEDDLVLDFFAGSCTTAHAVLEMNREDGGNRHFVVVQLPERTEGKEFSTLADIGKERVRRVIAKMKQDAAARLDLTERELPEDLGFKVFKLASPNVQQWMADDERDPEAYAQKLSLFNDPLVAGWKAENVIWEVALREGFSLNTRYTSRQLSNGNTVYDLLDPDTGQKVIICLDPKIGVDFSKHCHLAQDTLFVCRDVALDDSSAANLALQCRLKTI